MKRSQGSDLLFRFVVALSLVLGVSSGGKLSRLGDVKFQRIPWITGSFLIKYITALLFKGKLGPSPVVCTVVSSVVYFTLFYGLYPNLKLPGFFALTSGIFLNFLVIVANQGRMPVDPAGYGPGLLENQVEALAASLTHQKVHDNVRLRFLADIFGWKFFSKIPTTFSIGDVLMAAGISWFILHVMSRGFPDPQKDARIN
jgi:hypothetical protein